MRRCPRRLKSFRKTWRLGHQSKSLTQKNNRPPCKSVFTPDPATGAPHIYGHGVTEEEVADVLARPGEDGQGRDDSRIAIGQTRAGR